MNPERWARIQQLAEDALQRPPGERDAYLREAAGGDLDLLREATRLVAGASWDDSPLHSTIARAAGELVDRDSQGMVGRQIGPWRLLERLALGGMGAVYRAERAAGDFEQQVALKLVNPALVSPTVLARFQSERQILARLSHPNIARLLDGGTTEDGLPWLVMEYVQGESIDEWCRTRKASTAERLRLVLKVCAAVEYAHKNLIVHRDIKPANILVDAQGEPRLLDFGVAKLLAPDPTSAPTVTELRVMTPKYASPEQIRGEPITTATDIYSLGVLLYELLTERFPYADAASSPAALQKAICETQPERPSHGVPQLRRELAGDLDNIILMALRKEPEARYASVALLAMDIEACLDDRPVQAQPARWHYRTRKFLSRHRLGASMTAASLVALAALVVFHTHRLTQERDRALRAEQLAAQEAEAARDVSEFLVQTFSATDPLTPAPNPNITARELLDRAVTTLEADPSGHVPARIALTMGRAYAGLMLPTQAGELAERALREIESRGGAGSLEHAEALEVLANVASVKRDWNAARTHGERALQIYERLTGPSSAAVARTLLRLADIYMMLNVPDRMLSSAHRAVDILTKLRGTQSTARLDALLTLTTVSMAAGQFDDAAAQAREAREGFTKVLGPRHVKVAYAYHLGALVAYRQGRFREGLALAEKGLETMRAATGPQDQRLAGLLRMIYLNAKPLGDTRRAFHAARAAIAVNEAAPEPDPENLQLAYSNLGKLLLDDGLIEAAERQFKRCEELLLQIYGSDTHAEFAYIHLYYGTLARMRGDLPTARRRLDQAVAAHLSIHPPEHPEVLKMRMHREYVEYFGGDLARAASGLGEVVAALERGVGKEHPLRAQALGYLAAVNGALGHTELAEQQFQEAIQLLQKRTGPSSAFTLEVLKSHAEFAVRARGEAAARPALEQLAQAQAQAVHITEADLIR